MMINVPMGYIMWTVNYTFFKQIIHEDYSIFVIIILCRTLMEFIMSYLVMPWLACLYRHQCDLPEHFGKIDLWIANLISVYRKRRNVMRDTQQTPVVSMTTRLIYIVFIVSEILINLWLLVATGPRQNSLNDLDSLKFVRHDDVVPLSWRIGQNDRGFLLESLNTMKSKSKADDISNMHQIKSIFLVYQTYHICYYNSLIDQNHLVSKTGGTFIWISYKSITFWYQSLRKISLWKKSPSTLSSLLSSCLHMSNCPYR